MVRNEKYMMTSAASVMTWIVVVSFCLLLVDTLSKQAVGLTICSSRIKPSRDILTGINCQEEGCDIAASVSYHLLPEPPPVKEPR